MLGALGTILLLANACLFLVYFIRKVERELIARIDANIAAAQARIDELEEARND